MSDRSIVSVPAVRVRHEWFASCASKRYKCVDKKASVSHLDLRDDLGDRLPTQLCHPGHETLSALSQVQDTFRAAPHPATVGKSHSYPPGRLRADREAPAKRAHGATSLGPQNDQGTKFAQGQHVLDLRQGRGRNRDQRARRGQQHTDEISCDCVFITAGEEHLSHTTGEFLTSTGEFDHPHLPGESDRPTRTPTECFGTALNNRSTPGCSVTCPVL